MRIRRLASTIAVLLTLGGGLGVARADDEETEARLKACGVDELLRTDIHASIDRGVAWLLQQQYPDGGFSSTGPHPSPGALPVVVPSDAGYTALCALALRHAATPQAMRGFTEAKRFLVGAGPTLPEAVLDRTYVAGLTAMTIMADGGPPEAARDLGGALVRGQAPGGSWGYETTGPGAGPPVNLSTAQFGALGLWAAARGGARIPEEAWARVARGLVDTQAGGRWGYAASRSGASPRYPQGTFMGLANLLLAEAALRRWATPPAALLEEVAQARAAGEKALEKDVPRFLAAFDRFAAGGGTASDAGGYAPYYALYALEKACVFANVETVGGVHWYRRSARSLIRAQHADGSWGPAGRTAGQVRTEDPHVCTAFALLVLLRSSESYRPVTPRSVDRPQESQRPAEVTPSEPEDE